MVVLSCGVSPVFSGPVQWTRDGFGLGLDPDLPEFPGYFLAGDDKGNYDLTISPVSMNDDAIYQCQAPPLASPLAHLNVQAPPSHPVIEMASGRGVEHQLGSASSQGEEHSVGVSHLQGEGYILVEE